MMAYHNSSSSGIGFTEAEALGGCYV